MSPLRSVGSMLGAVLSLCFIGCGGDGTRLGGSGGSGVIGAGGTTETGGYSGSGGRSVGSGGTPGSGGISGSGGVFGSGGMTGSGGVTGSGGSAGVGGSSGGVPPTQTVRVFWLRPSDVPYDDAHFNGIVSVLGEAQRYYKQELGKTFRLNTPAVEVVVGEHLQSWYENTPNGGEKYWWSVFNMRDELVRRFKLRQPDSRWLIVGEVSAEGDGAGGGASVGFVMLPQHDADGAAGLGGNMNRWYGGMVHELGHAFGLPDSASTDGTPMSASFYSYPNTHFTQNQKNAILNGPYASFLF